MKKVLVGTPAHDGRLEVYYVQALMETISYMKTKQFDVHPVFMSYDSLVQRARNDLIKIAIEQDYDYLFFIDSDMTWDPQWMYDLIQTPQDVMEVAGTGMAFTKITKNAFTKVWDISKPYKNGERDSRMVFDIGIDDEGELYSEDTAFCNKWKSLGGTTWVNISMTCGHIGSKVFTGNFKQYFEEYVDRYGKNKK
jgi:hypothetical protein